MAHIGALPGFQRIVTGHDSEGKALIIRDEAAPWDGDVEGGRAAFSLGYITSSTPVDFKNDEDVQKYDEYLSTKPGLVERNGSVLRFVVRLLSHTSYSKMDVALKQTCRTWHQVLLHQCIELSP